MVGVGQSKSDINLLFTVNLMAEAQQGQNDKSIGYSSPSVCDINGLGDFMKSGSYVERQLISFASLALCVIVFKNGFLSVKY